MSGIVVITTKGAAKRDFINSLQRKTNGAVKLAILQSVKRKNIFQRIKSFYKKVGWLWIIPEIYYFLSIRFSSRKQQALSLISTRSKMSSDSSRYLAKTMITDDINENKIYEVLNQIKPDVIAIWGGYVLEPRILRAAQRVVNIHFGFAPYYRGVNGIEHALLNDDFKHLGITIHYAVSEVDAGEIIQIIHQNHEDSPDQFFKSLNDTALKDYVEVVKELSQGKKFVSKAQDLTKGKNHLLKEWTYRKRNALANKLLAWQEAKK